mgnify:CR=1 FL=1
MAFTAGAPSIQPLLDNLQVTELMYNPSAGVGAEYIEIRNIGASPANLAGVALTSGVTFTLPATVLAAGALWFSRHK